MGSLIDCVGKAEAAGLLNPAERQAILRRADELSKVMNREQAERTALEEGQKQADKAGRISKDKVVISTKNQNVAYAAYMEEMRNVQEKILTQEQEAIRYGKATTEADILGKEVGPEGVETEPGEASEPREFLAQITPSAQHQLPSTEEQLEEAATLGSTMSESPGISKVTAQQSVTMWDGAPRNTINMGWTAANNANMTAMLNAMAVHSALAGKDSLIVARRLRKDEENPNARPGMEIVFSEPLDMTRLEGILGFLRERGIQGVSLIPHSVSIANREAITFSGMSLQVIPELARMPVSSAPDTLLDLADELSRIVKIKGLEHHLFDTLVLTRQDYDRNGILDKSPGQVRSTAWTDRTYYAAHPATTAQRAQEAAARAPRTPGTTAQKVAPSKELETAAALVAAGRAAPEKAQPIYERVFRKLLDLQQQHRAVIAGMEFAPTKPGEMTKTKILQAIGELDALLKYMPPEIRGKVGGYFQIAKIAESEKKLTEFFRERVTKMADMLEGYMQDYYRKRIEKLFKSAKPKKTEAGVVTGTLTPETHQDVERIQGYSQMTGQQLLAATMGIEAELAAGGLTPEQESARIIAQHEMQTFGAMAEMTARELEHAYNSLQQIIQTGRTAWRMSEEVRLANQKAKAEELKAAMPFGTEPGIAARNEQTIVTWIGNYLRTHFNFAQLLERILPQVSFLKDWQDRTFAAERNEGAFVLRINQELNARLQAAAGTKSAIKIGMLLREGHLKNIEIPGGKASKMDAIHFVMAWQQQSERERMKKQGWSEENIAALENEISDPVSQAFMGFLRWAYDTIYESANEVHKNLYGIDLPKNEFYVPMRYNPVGVAEERTAILGSIFGVSGLTPSAIKTRIAHNAPLKTVSALDVFEEHLMEMSHWIHFAEMGREMRNVLNDMGIKQSLQQQLGEKGYRDVVSQLDTIIRGGAARASDVSPVRDLIRHVTSGTAITALGFNLHAVGMQIDSAARWALEIPLTRWVPTLLSGHLWNLESVKKVLASDAIQQRLIDKLPPGIQEGMTKTGVKANALLAAVRYGFLPLRLFDTGGTLLSGLVVYADAREQGLSEEQALTKAENAISKLSQPTGMTNKSQVEISSSIGVKAMSMFMSDPRLKAAMYLEAWGNLAKGKDIGMNLQRIAIVHGFGLITQALGNVLAYAWPGDDDDDYEKLWDWKNYLAAIAIAPTQGYFFLGALIQSAISAATGQRVYSRLTPISAFGETLLRSVKPFFGELYNAMKDPDNFKPEKFWKSIDGMISTAGVAGGPGAAGLASALRQVKRTYDSYNKEEK